MDFGTEAGQHLELIQVVYFECPSNITGKRILLDSQQTADSSFQSQFHRIASEVNAPIVEMRLVQRLRFFKLQSREILKLRPSGSILRHAHAGSSRQYISGCRRKMLAVAMPYRLRASASSS